MTRRCCRLGRPASGARQVESGSRFTFPPIRGRVGAACLLVALVASFVPRPASSRLMQAVDPCDQSLVRSPDDPLAYGRRGERCEGLYIREVSGSAGILLASFTETIPAFELSAGERLHVEWSPPTKSAVRLRAVALRHRLYYRMDAVRPAGARVFEWPGDILASLRLRSQEIGIVGWTDPIRGTGTEEVYLPLRISGQNPIERTGRYVLLVVPGTELSEVFVTLSEVAPDGRDGAILRRDEPLKYGFYPAERSVRIPLPALPRAGLYRLRVGATLSRGGSATRNLLFYHSDN